MKTWNSLRSRRKSSRAVSPIIATILLVAITVVLAAVLYILVSGLISGGSKPYSLAFAGEASASYGAVNVVNFTVSATAGLTTGLFGLKIATPGGATVALGAVPAACSTAGAFTGCTAPAANTWYAVLVNSNGAIQATYGSASGAWTPGNAPVPNSDSICLVSPTAFVLSGSSDTLSAFGSSGSTVSGQATL